MSLLTSSVALAQYLAAHLPHTVVVPTLNRDIVEWCETTLGPAQYPREQQPVIRWFRLGNVYLFRDAEDAVFFKLRWQ